MRLVRNSRLAVAIATITAFGGLVIGGVVNGSGGAVADVNPPSHHGFGAFNPKLHKQGDRCTAAGRRGVWVVDHSKSNHRWVCDTDDGLPTFNPSAHAKGDSCTSNGRVGGWMPIDSGHGREWVCYTDR
ncbi:hypothetical protein GCM10010528_00320 [Gordonia defluvii]|uniref:Secreted protein n=1 Tax=Gordonia defluvii TaxID=283718 RepID=A0ABN3Y7R8_9ACTN